MTPYKQQLDEYMRVNDFERSKFYFTHKTTGMDISEEEARFFFNCTLEARRDELKTAWAEVSMDGGDVHKHIYDRIADLDRLIEEGTRK